MRRNFLNEYCPRVKDTYHTEPSGNETMNHGNEGQPGRRALRAALIILGAIAFYGFIVSKTEERTAGINKTTTHAENISGNPGRLTIAELRKIEGCENISAKEAEEKISHAYQWAKLLLYSFHKTY